MNESKLTNQQQAAAQLLATGNMEKQAIAKQLDVSRTTLWQWEKNDNFIAEVDRLKREFRNFGTQLVESKLVEAVNGYWDLIQKTNNDMVAKSGYEFFIERSLGKVTNNVKLTTEVENVKRLDEDILEAEQEKWLKEIEEETE